MYKHAVKIAILIIALCSGFFFAKVYQPAGKAIPIYKNALKDYDNANYSQAYYLFSRIGYLSSFKPIAIYRQALCAKALGDKKTELNSYQRLIKFYPTSPVTMEARYQAGQLLVDSNPKLARKYFKIVANSNIQEDYKIASNYYMAKLQARGKTYSEVSKNKAEKIEDAFRQYLEHAPDGRLAVSVAKSWQKFNSNLSEDDAVLIARVYYLASMYEEAKALFNNINEEKSWAFLASVNFANNSKEKAVQLTEEGVLKYANTATDEDYKSAVDGYINSFTDNQKYTYASKLFSLAKGKNKDYIWNLKCTYAPKAEKAGCFKSLYTNYPGGEYAQNALLQLFYLALADKNYVDVRSLSQDYLRRFANSESAAEVMFWGGKALLKYSRKAEANNIFQEVITKFPDSYYAYRAFWISKGVVPSVIMATLEYKPVVYPYKYPQKGNILNTLLAVEDYELVTKFSNDEFIKSWVEYKKGNYSVSARMARDAMAKLKEKPVKNDLRWRLVYPQNYYVQVHRYASEHNNNDALIMSIIREESYFNSEAQSSVGAIGLMQLMPSTAHEIGQKHDISFNTHYLLNPELNIRLGNIYFSSLKSMFNNNEVFAVAAYNGGVGAVSKWKAASELSDIDEFIEQIPYEETKTYVKKVFRSYWNYTRIYQEQ